MLDFAQKRKLRSLLYHRVTLGILALLVILAARSAWLAYDKLKESQALQATALKTVAELEARNNDLSAHIDRLNTPQGVEAEIRDKFNVAKDNENMVIVVDESQATSTERASQSWWQKFLNLFHK